VKIARKAWGSAMGLLPINECVEARVPALPAPQSAPVADLGRQFVDTAKAPPPSSVTEQTTSRLNKV